MPQLYPNINRLNTSNYPGCLSLDLINEKNTGAFPITQVGVNINLMTQPENWLQILPKGDSMTVSQQVSFKGGARIYTIVATGVISKTTTPLVKQMFELGSQRFVGLVTTRNGNRLLVGTKQFPATLRLSDRKTGNAPNNPNDQSFELRVTSKFPLLTYNGVYQKPSSLIIDRLKEKNYPGCLYLDICPAQFMINYDDSNFFVSDDIMNNYDFWTRIYCKNETLTFQEAINYKNGSRLFASTVSGELSKVSEANLNNLFLMGFSKFVGIVTDRNGNRHIIGAPAEPALLQFTEATTGKDLSATPNLQLSLTCERNRPSKTYEGTVILPGEGGEEGGGDPTPSNPNAILWPDFQEMVWPDFNSIDWH